MGDIKRHRKKYKTPMHPYEKKRILEEAKLRKDYGYKNKKELWKMQTILKAFREQAKKLIALKTPQGIKEKKELIEKLSKLGLINKTAKIDDILALNLDDILNKRLQTIVFKKNLAKTVNQARQMITHGHIKVNNKVITSPSYLVKEGEEIVFSNNSPFIKTDHPMRSAGK